MGSERNGFINKIKKDTKKKKEAQHELFNNCWSIAIDLACSGMQRQFPSYNIKEEKKIKEEKDV